MIFIHLGKIRTKLDKAATDRITQRINEFKNQGITILNLYWTLGHYDIVIIFSADNEKEALNFSMGLTEFIVTETMTAIPIQQDMKLP